MIKQAKRTLVTAVVAAVTCASLVAPAAASAWSIKMSGSTTVQPIATKLASAYKKKTGNTVTVAGGGSSVGINDVSAGKVAIGMSSRDLKQSELDKGLVPTAFARDALVIIKNPGNPVTNLTQDQVKRIYTGKITNWKQVGGPNRRIIVCGRTAASGTYEFFKEAFLGGTRQYSGVRQYASNGMVRSQVVSNKYAVGYVGMAFVNTKVRALKIGGVTPTRTNALSGKYKYVRKLYWVTKGAPSGNASAFISYTKGTAGQSIVATEFLKLK